MSLESQISRIVTNKVIYITADAFKYSHLVFASVTYNGEMFVCMEHLLRDLVSHGLRDRRIALIENGSWASCSGKKMWDMLSSLGGAEFIGETLSFKSSMSTDGLAKLGVLVDEIIKSVQNYDSYI